MADTGESLVSRTFLSSPIVSLALGTLAVAVVVQLATQVISGVRRRYRDRRALKHIPGPPPHWLWGNIQDFTFDDVYLGRLVAWTVKYAGLLKAELGFMTMVYCSSAKYISTILNTAEPKDHLGYRFVEPWIGDGLLVSKGKKWARNRRLLTPAFHFDILKPYVGLFNNSAKTMVEKWKCLTKEEQTSVEMFHQVSLFTLDSLLKCIFGYVSDCQNEGRKHPYIKSVYELAELLIARYRFAPYFNDWIYYFSWSGYKFRRASREAHKFTNEVIRKKKADRKIATEGGTEMKKKYLDFLDMLLDCRDEDGKGLSDKEIRDEADTFMFEGHDTTASGISWILYNLAHHPEYQEKCRQEVMDVLGDRNEVTWEDLPKFEYLTMCIKESMRLHTTVPAIGRHTTRPLTFPDGRTIPADSWVAIGIYACHNDPGVWPNPEVYDPERFSSENTKDRSPHAYVPFSAGPRNCIGQHFAMHEMKTCVAVVLKHFRLKVDPTKPAITAPDLVLRSKNGIWLDITPLSG